MENIKEARRLIIEEGNRYWDAYKESDNETYGDIVDLLDEALSLLREASHLMSNVD